LGACYLQAPGRQTFCWPTSSARWRAWPRRHAGQAEPAAVRAATPRTGPLLVVWEQRDPPTGRTSRRLLL